MQVWNNYVTDSATSTIGTCGVRTTSNYGIGKDSTNIDRSADTLGTVYVSQNWDRCIPNWLTTMYFHILSTGESLSMGVKSTPALSMRQPYNNLMLSPNVIGDRAPLIPLVENMTYTNQGESLATIESPSSGIANSLRAYDNVKRSVTVGLHGQSGAPYNLIKKNSTNGDSYKNGQKQASVTKTAVEALGGVYVPLAVTLHHGETDEVLGNGPYYA